MKLSEEEERILNRFKMRLKEALNDNLLEVRLFGSKARGDAREDSDIDVLVIVSSEDWHMSDAVYSIVTDIMLETEICISPKVISQKDYTRLYSDRNPFIENVIREGIVL